VRRADHVHEIELKQAESANRSAQVAQIDASSRSRSIKSLGGQRDPAGFGYREADAWHGPMLVGGR